MLEAPAASGCSPRMFELVAVLCTLVRAARRMAADPTNTGLVLLVGGLVAGGATFHHRIEDFSWVDSFYFTVITLTTVGHGDLAPQTPAGKVFTLAYVLIGVGLLIAFVTEAARHLIAAGTPTARRRDREGPPPE